MKENEKVLLIKDIKEVIAKMKDMQWEHNLNSYYLLKLMNIISDLQDFYLSINKDNDIDIDMI